MVRIFALLIFLIGVEVGAAEQVLQASKDLFARSNERTRNSGASPHLLVAHNPSVRSLVGFDLSGVTNRIVGAQVRLCPMNSVEASLNLTVAPMVPGAANAAWGEGRGVLGMKGQNAMPGAACFAFSAFPDVPWKGAGGTALSGLNDAALWGVRLCGADGLFWKEGAWLSLPINNAAWLEKQRISNEKRVTLGLWGTAGNGFYQIYSKESGKGVQLILNVTEGK